MEGCVVAHGRISHLDSQGKSSKSLISPSVTGSLRALLVLVSRLIGRLEVLRRSVL
jgi:hypothetical protein